MDKIYQVINISFYHMAATARETELSLAVVPENEVFDLSDLHDFKVTLVNDGGQVQIVKLKEWKVAHKRE